MTLPSKRFFRNATTAARVLFGVVRQIDYQALNRYIVAINQSPDSREYFTRGVLLPKEILNYHLFAFAVKDGEKLDVWIDPHIHQVPLKRVLKRDFGSIENFQVHTVNEEMDSAQGLLAFEDKDLLAYSLMDDKCMGRMYILPERKMFPYHNEILDIIVKTLGVALKNYCKGNRKFKYTDY